MVLHYISILRDGTNQKEIINLIMVGTFPQERERTQS
jgi:hypothetical protein